MQPQTPTPLPNGYDFLQTGNQSKKSWLGGNSKQKRMLIVGAGTLVVIILAIIIVTIFQNANKPKTELLVSVLQDQQEIARIAEIGSTKAKGSETLNYSSTLLQTVRSDQKALVSVLGKKFKVPAKTLAAKQSKKTDEVLTSAEQTNRLDEAVTELLQNHLQTYRTDLRAAYDGNPGPKTRSVLQSAFDNTKTFVETGDK